MGTRPKNIDQAIEAATKVLLGNATDSRGVDLTALIPRVRKVVDKYLLRDNENATEEEIRSFIASLQIDDLE